MRRKRFSPASKSNTSYLCLNSLPHPSKAGTDEIVADSGGVHCYVNPVYTGYVLTRYPNANILIKGPTDQILFMVSGQLRAVVSPWTKLPDGTPLL